MNKIILIDQGRDILPLQKKILDARTHQVLIAGNDSDGLKMAAEEGVELIVISIDGSERGRFVEIKKAFNLNGVILPVVFVSGEVTPEFETQAMEAGIVDVLRKELGMDNIFDRICRILQTKERLRQGHEKKIDKILIVDDEPTVLTLLGDFFTGKNIRTMLAPSGQEALDLVETERPMVVLLDIVMPEMDGLETLRRIKEIDPGLGVIMATGLQDEKVARQAMALGAYDYVTKPFDMKYLEFVVLTRLAIAN